MASVTNVGDSFCPPPPRGTFLTTPTTFLSPPGAIEHRDRPNVPVKHFTQADVNHGKIVYRPPAAPSHLQELYQYSFIGETASPRVQPGLEL